MNVSKTHNKMRQLANKLAGLRFTRRCAWRVCRAWHLTSEVQVLVPGIRRAEG